MATKLSSSLVDVEGLDAYNRTIERIEKTESPKVARAAVRGGAGPMMSGIRRAIPRAKTRGHSNRSTKLALGRRTINKGNLFLVKMGFMVGKRKPGRNGFANMVIKGTKSRRTNGTGANRGAIENTRAVPTGVKASLPAAMAAAGKSAAKAIERIKKT